MIRTNRALRFVWLEVTGKCQLLCQHCYAASGPKGSHGSMTDVDWLAVIDQTAGLGVEMVQFIGGEPTLHPSLPMLLEHALSRGLEVEVFSNLTHVSPEIWELASRRGVRLATSYYSDEAKGHEAITKGRGSARRTRENIGKAVALGVRLRVGIIELADTQRVHQAREELLGLGVPSEEIDFDRLRQVGRGERTERATMTQLCGNCTSGVLAVSPDGKVWPCVFARWLPVGNVREQTLEQILAGATFAETTAQLAQEFDNRPPSACRPTCRPHTPCKPSGGEPCYPATRCQPDFTCGPRASCQPALKCGPTPNGDCRPTPPDPR